MFLTNEELTMDNVVGEKEIKDLECNFIPWLVEWLPTGIGGSTSGGISGDGRTSGGW